MHHRYLKWNDSYVLHVLGLKLPCMCTKYYFVCIKYQIFLIYLLPISTHKSRNWKINWLTYSHISEGKGPEKWICSDIECEVIPGIDVEIVVEDILTILVDTRNDIDLQEVGGGKQ